MDARSSREPSDRELHDLLFGVHGPSPALLVDLAPILPESLLRDAITIASNIRDPDLALRILAALAARVLELGLASRFPQITPFEDRTAAPGQTATTQLLRELPESRRNALLRDVLGALSRKLRRRGIEAPPIKEFVLGEKFVPPPEKRLVSTGFADLFQPDGYHPKDVPLAPSHSYYFWLEVGEQQAGAIDEAPSPLPTELLPREARLHVVLFPFEDEIEITPGADVGELQVQKDGMVSVARQPMEGRPDAPWSERFRTRLFFPIRTPVEEGTHRLRCNIYYQQVLVQSRVVSGTVMANAIPTEGALKTVLDYTLSESLDLAPMASLTPHRFSLMVNSNGDGTHSFRFFGVNGSDANSEIYKPNVPIDGNLVQAWLQDARKALHYVSWGDEGEWDDGKTYRYQNPPTFQDLARDLGRLAITGYRIYSKLAQRLGVDGARDLENLIYEPGPVQIALKADARFVIPAALIYDYPWDTNSFPLATAPYELCPNFQQAMLGPDPLEECTCFRGQCPVKAEADRINQKDSGLDISALGPKICPSGFWGFRHSLGLPVSLLPAADADQIKDPNAAPSAKATTVIRYRDQPQIALGVSTDPELKAFKDHEQHLLHLDDPQGWKDWKEARTRKDVIQMLKTSRAQLIYFFCHGGVTQNRNPFLDVGYQDVWLTPDNLAANKIQWLDPDPHPLIFLNGCHTTAVEQQVALEFVSAFAYAQAAGVIGTEITVFDALAADFAEECLRRFVVEQQTIGDAVRGARLALLKKRNPLGLIYTPFVIESVRLEPEPGPPQIVVGEDRVAVGGVNLNVRQP